MTASFLRNVAQSLAAIALVTVGSSAFGANTLTLNTNSFSDIYQGGEFTANNSGLSLSNYGASALLNLNNGEGIGFETFCVDIAEEFNPAGTYDYTLGADIINPDLTDSPLTIGAAWLYAEFATGTLNDYDYALSGTGGTTFSSRQAAAGALQSAIWFLQSEGTIDNSPSGSYDASNPFEVAVASQFSGGTIANPDLGGEVAANGAYGVDVLVLTNANGGLAQPQLYLDAPANLPDHGTTLVLLGIALIGLVAFQRRFAGLKTAAL